MDAVHNGAMARNRAFRIFKILIHGAEADTRGKEIDFRVGAIQIGRFFDCCDPGLSVEFEFRDRLDRLQSGCVREIVERLRAGILAHHGFFLRESFVGHFVGTVRGQPELAAKRDGIVIERRQVHGT